MLRLNFELAGVHVVVAEVIRQLVDCIVTADGLSVNGIFICSEVVVLNLDARFIPQRGDFAGDSI